MSKTIISKDYKKGIIKTGTWVSIVAAATPTLVYTLTAGRTCKLRKLHIWNGQAVAVQITIGDGLGVGFVQRIPLVLVLPSGTAGEVMFTEEQLQDWEFTATITAQSSAAAAAPADIQIQATVEEYQGPTG